MKFFDDMEDDTRAFSILIFSMFAFALLTIVIVEVGEAARDSKCMEVLTACYQSGKQDCECKL